MTVGPKTRLLLRRYTEVEDDMKSFDTTFADVKYLKGTLRTASEREVDMAMRRSVQLSHKFRTAYRPDLAITTEDIFTLGSRTFEITSAGADPYNQNRFSTYNLWEKK